MSQCSSGYGWYIGKFFLGFAGMYILYVTLLRTSKPKCVCQARARDAARRKGKECCCCAGSQDDANACKAKKSCNELAAASSCPSAPRAGKKQKPTRFRVPGTAAAAPKTTASCDKCPAAKTASGDKSSAKKSTSSDKGAAKETASSNMCSPNCRPAPVLRRLHPPDGDSYSGQVCLEKENKTVTYQVTECSNGDPSGEPNNVKISVTFQDCVKFDVTMTEATNMIENSNGGSDNESSKQSSVHSCKCPRIIKAGKVSSDPQVIGEFFVEVETKKSNSVCSIKLLDESVTSSSSSESTSGDEDENSSSSDHSSDSSSDSTCSQESSHSDARQLSIRNSICKMSRCSISKLSRKADSCKSRASSILGGLLNLFVPRCEKIPTPCRSEVFQCQDCCANMKNSIASLCKSSASLCSKNTFVQKYRCNADHQHSNCSVKTYNVCGGRLTGGSQASLRSLPKFDDSVDDFSDSEMESRSLSYSKFTSPVNSSESKMFLDSAVNACHGHCVHCQRNQREFYDSCGRQNCHQHNRIIFTM